MSQLLFQVLLQLPAQMLQLQSSLHQLLHQQLLSRMLFSAVVADAVFNCILRCCSASQLGTNSCQPSRQSSYQTVWKDHAVQEKDIDVPVVYLCGMRRTDCGYSHLPTTGPSASCATHADHHK